MGFLRRVFGSGGQAVPEWASFFSADEYRAFLDAVAADLARRGRTFTFGDGVVLVDQEDGEPAQLGLSNLSQLCNGRDQADWPGIIAGHFSNLFATVGRDLDALAADYDQVRPILRVRLMPDATMGGRELPESVMRPIAPGILAVLVYDFPDSTASVHRDHVDAWPVDEDTALAQALDNLDAEPKPLRDDLVDDDASVTLWYGDSFYVATWLMRLADRLPADTTDAIVGVPNRHTLLVHVVRDERAIASMSGIYQMAAGLFRDGPGSISDQPYWWHEGEIVQIPHAANGKRTSIAPPDAFLAMLERVAARSADD